MAGFGSRSVMLTLHDDFVAMTADDTAQAQHADAFVGHCRPDSVVCSSLHAERCLRSLLNLYQWPMIRAAAQGSFVCRRSDSCICTCQIMRGHAQHAANDE